MAKLLASVLQRTHQVFADLIELVVSYSWR